MENEKLYLGTNGKYYQEHEMHNAYFIATGNDVYSDSYNQKRFEIWVYNLIGRSIQKAVDINDVTYHELITANQRLLAVRLYRERNNTTLREAKEAIDAMEKEVVDSAEDNRRKVDSLL